MLIGDSKLKSLTPYAGWNLSNEPTVANTVLSAWPLRIQHLLKEFDEQQRYDKFIKGFLLAYDHLISNNHWTGKTMEVSLDNNYHLCGLGEVAEAKDFRITIREDTESEDEDEDEE